MPSQTITKARDCKCCCKNCNHDELVGCDICCRCIPRSICITFNPDAISGTTLTAEVDHTNDGVYASGIGVTVTLGVNDNGDCVWTVSIDENPGTVYDVSQEFLVSTVGCLTETGDSLVLNNVVINNVDGTLTITPIFGEIIPLVRRANNCVERLCSNCTCFPSCACIRYNIEFFEEEDPVDPDAPLDKVGSIRRIANVCWDPDVGVNGGWFVEFDEILDLSCSPAITILIEIRENESTGLCEIIATVGPPGNTNQDLDEEVSLTSLICDSISNSWEFGNADADTGTGAIISGSTTASLPATLISISIITENCNDCVEQCCEYLPATLIATIEAAECTTSSPPVEVTLTRTDCHSAAYTGSASIPWDCEGETGGTGTLTMAFACTRCEFDHLNQKCACDCEGDENPGITGCGSLTQFLLTNFDGFTIGNPSNKFAECGASCGDLGGFSDSGCDPIHAEFCIPVQGLGACCDFWTCIITEP